MICTSECCATVRLSGIFFSKSTDKKLAYKLVETLFTRCSLLSACFSFGLFLFCLPDMCACAIFWENQNKCKWSIEITRRTPGITVLARHNCLCSTAKKNACALKRKRSFTDQAVYM